MSENATLQLPKDLIESAIRQHVQVAIAAALGDKAKVLEMAVAQVLTGKVDSEGKPSRGFGTDVEFVQWAVRDSMTKAVRDCLLEEIEKHKDTIRKNIAEQLAKKNSPLLKMLVESMTTGLVNVASNKWRLSVTYGDNR